MEMGNASFLEASRRSWKEGGGDKPGGIKGRAERPQRESSARGLLVVFCFFGGLGLWKSGLWSNPFVGARSRWSSQSAESPGIAPGTRTGGAALPAVSREPARPCEKRRRELAGPAEGPSSAAAILAAVGTGRRDSPHQGTTRAQVTCNGLVGPFWSPRPHVIKAHGPRLTPLSVRGSFLAFLLNECCGAESRKYNCVSDCTLIIAYRRL